MVHILQGKSFVREVQYSTSKNSQEKYKSKMQCKDLTTSQNDAPLKSYANQQHFATLSSLTTASLVLVQYAVVVCRLNNATIIASIGILQSMGKDCFIVASRHQLASYFWTCIFLANPYTGLRVQRTCPVGIGTYPTQLIFLLYRKPYTLVVART